MSLTILTQLEMQAEYDNALAEAKKAQAYQKGISKADETIQALAKKLGDMQIALDQERAQRLEMEKLNASKEAALGERIVALEAQKEELEKERDKYIDVFGILRRAAKAQDLLSPPIYQKVPECLTPRTARYKAERNQKIHDMHQMIYDVFQQID